ncbi:type II secretion system F family protein [bacterium]|nr:type II secretion system F family protein [bacterium]
MLQLELLHGLLIFSAVALVAYLFVDRIQSAAQEVSQAQAEQGAKTFSDLYLSIPPELFFFGRALVALIAFFLVMPLHIVPAITAAVAGWFVPAMYLKRLKEKRLKKIEEQLVDGLELLGNGLKSGLTLQQALELLMREFPPPITQEFGMVLAETRLGVDLVDALHNMATRLNSTIVSILVAGISITKRCGGDLTEIFQNIAATIREQALIEGKLNAVTAQGRFQGLILSIMPFALIVILYFVDRGHVEILFGFKLGLIAFFAVIVMVCLAQLWIRKLLAIDV